MHICPAEIVAALFMFEHMNYACWYCVWRAKEILHIK